MIPSQRVYFLLLLGITIAPALAIFFNLPASITGTLLYDTGILFLMLVDAIRVRTHRIQVRRGTLGRLSIGRENPVVLLVQTGKRRAQIQIRDSYPVEFEVSAPALDAALQPDTAQELTYTVQPKNRGEYQWGDIHVRQLGPWGLAWHDWKIPAVQKVAVYPDLIALRALAIRLTLLSTGNMSQSRRFGMGTEFAELREYSAGDDFRLIDWKATSRRLGTFGKIPLQVRVLEPEQEQTLMILLDRGRLMTARLRGLKRFDWGLNATLALALAGLNRGDRVGVGVFDREITAWIPPERGQQHLNRIIERLTPIQPVLLEPDYMGAVTALVKQQTRRSLVVLITDIVDSTASSELLAALGRITPRYLPFCVTLRDPQVDNLAHTSIDVFNGKKGEISAAYNRAVALDLLSQRQVAFAQLKQKGVLVLDAPVDRISSQLVDRYLQLKARNQL
jgi:uncharacterized protein (DUF58 family)